MFQIPNNIFCHIYLYFPNNDHRHFCVPVCTPFPNMLTVAKTAVTVWFRFSKSHCRWYVITCKYPRPSIVQVLMISLSFVYSQIYCVCYSPKFAESWLRATKFASMFVHKNL